LTWPVGVLNRVPSRAGGDGEVWKKRLLSRGKEENEKDPSINIAKNSNPARLAQVIKYRGPRKKANLIAFQEIPLIGTNGSKGMVKMGGRTLYGRTIFWAMRREGRK